MINHRECNISLCFFKYYFFPPAVINLNSTNSKRAARWLTKLAGFQRQKADARVKSFLPKQEISSSTLLLHLQAHHQKWTVNVTLASMFAMKNIKDS